MALRCGGGQRDICIGFWKAPRAPGEDKCHRYCLTPANRYKFHVALPRIVKPFESELGMKSDLAISSTAMAKRLVTSDGRIDFRWRFWWFCRTHLALQTPRKTNLIGKVFNSLYALVWWRCEECISFLRGFSRVILMVGVAQFPAFPFFQLGAYWERNIERRALKLRQQQGNKHRNKVYKFKLYYLFEFRVSRSTKISHTFPHNLALWHMTPRSLGRLWW